jgi:hypothetical protein
MKKLVLEDLGRRRVEVDFSAGHVSSDGGALLLREVDQRLELTKRIAEECFTDHRNPNLIEHTVADLIRQRTYGIVQGYEDLNDHDRLSRDPLLATIVGKSDPVGHHRRLERDRGKPLASASTLGRIERTAADADATSRYEKVVCDFGAMGRLFAQIFIESFDSPPLQLTLDLDPSDVTVHGEQEQRFYHGYYGHYCYLPIYLYCGQHPLAVKLRPSNIDGALGAVEFLEPVVTQLREKWPDLRILIRGDSGFCREGLMAWCEGNNIDYVLGMARNSRLVGAIAKQMEQARREHLRSGRSARRFRSFWYRTLKSWSRKRRIVGKAEYSAKGANPRFVVTSLAAREYERRYVYEELYCARGEMENRIKEQQLDLFGDRASCHAFRGNEIRMWLSMAAQILIVALRRLALAGTELAQAQAGTLRVRLLKIGALVAVSVRRVYIRLSSAFPLQDLLAVALQRLRSPPVAPPP